MQIKFNGSPLCIELPFIVYCPLDCVCIAGPRALIKPLFDGAGRPFRRFGRRVSRARRVGLGKNSQGFPLNLMERSLGIQARWRHARK
jgi:hypothetical protein